MSITNCLRGEGVDPREARPLRDRSARLAADKTRSKQPVPQKDEAVQSEGRHRVARQRRHGVRRRPHVPVLLVR